ncbi:MAG TPA: hypothetical protein VGO91_20035 [Pyrinomonadaceae bacterium]|nr:hypothetical protein [Pyrinomonadaceae bacterium]
MKKSLNALLIIALLSCTALAGTGSGDWTNVKKLKAGSRVVVQTKTGRVVKGEVRLVTNETIFLEATLPDGSVQDVTLDKSDVAEVSKRGGRGAGINPLLGAAIGLGVGVAVGAGSDAAHRGGDDPGIGKLAFGLLGTTTGLAVGSAIHARDKTIYVAP